MATTKKSRPRRRPTPQPTAQDRFTGLTGTWKAVAQFGLSGVVAATMMYAVLIEMPRQQQLHLEMSEKARTSGYEHGERAVDKISASIDSLATKWSAVQGVTQTNQRELISTQRRTNELLEQQTNTDPPTGLMSPANSEFRPIGPLPEWTPVLPRPKQK